MADIKWVPCRPVCKGWAWFSSNGSDQDLHIEKCDECGRFETDEDAQKFAYIEINSKPAMIEMMKHYSDAEQLTAAWVLLGKKKFR